MSNLFYRGGGVRADSNLSILKEAKKNDMGQFIFSRWVGVYLLIPMPKKNTIVCGHVPWLYQYWPGWFMLFVVLCPGTPEGSTGSDSGFKASQKTGQRLKVSSDRLGEAGNRTCDPWFTRHRFIP